MPEMSRHQTTEPLSTSVPPITRFSVTAIGAQVDEPRAQQANAPFAEVLRRHQHIHVGAARMAEPHRNVVAEEKRPWHATGDSGWA